MTQKLVHQIVGYDPETEFLAFEQDIPLEKWERVKSLLTHDDDDPEFVYSCPLEYGLANDIMGIVGASGARDLHYYVECSDVS